MHAYDDSVELILITEGQSRIFIGEKEFPGRQGDLIIFNSKFVHDEYFCVHPSFLYCIGIRNIKEPGLRKNALISDQVCLRIHTKALAAVLGELFKATYQLLQEKRKIGRNYLKELFCLTFLLAFNNLRYGVKPLLEKILL
ncbi:AraC family ligand binding domain-containing protein [Lactobacillus sp. DCY120]|uniref:AraC family ligand binding domain-containing protein n=2 Tax=Bombilactobacillus apium TaxID=2675299 RepID=A0A850R8N5_9LACO|nr:AraC family ligand binding domain-containing protein [Bombilactobacillus apium]